MASWHIYFLEHTNFLAPLDQLLYLLMLSYAEKKIGFRQTVPVFQKTQFVCDIIRAVNKPMRNFRPTSAMGCAMRIFENFPPKTEICALVSAKGVTRRFRGRLFFQSKCYKDTQSGDKQMVKKCAAQCRLKESLNIIAQGM